MPNRNTASAFQRFLLIVLFITCACSFTQAQKIKKTYSSSLLTRFPFKLLSGGIIILGVTLADFPDTLNFILDTGSGGISLDSATVSHFRLPITPTERLLRGIGSIRKISYVKDQTLHLPDLDVEHLDFHINDYDLLTSVYGIKIDGIAGFSLLNRYIVKINYDTHMIEIWSPGTIKYPRAGMLIKPVINGIPVFNASVADAESSKSRFYFDTGAGLCLLLSEEYERDSSILKKGRKVVTTQAEGLGGKEPMKLSIVKEVKIGRYKFKKVPVHIFHDEYKVTSYPYLGGLIGNDLLRRFNLIINYGQKEMHLKPNTHFPESFDYSYTGLGIYMVNGEITIEDVLKDSPGDKAGLQPGDVLIGIDSNISRDMQTYKNMLQAPGSRLKLLVMRNGVPLIANLKVATIL